MAVAARFAKPAAIRLADHDALVHFLRLELTTKSIAIDQQRAPVCSSTVQRHDFQITFAQVMAPTALSRRAKPNVFLGIATLVKDFPQRTNKHRYSPFFGVRRSSNLWRTRSGSSPCPGTESSAASA